MSNMSQDLPGCVPYQRGSKISGNPRSSTENLAVNHPRPSTMNQSTSGPSTNVQMTQVKFLDLEMFYCHISIVTDCQSNSSLFYNHLGVCHLCASVCVCVCVCVYVCGCVCVCVGLCSKFSKQKHFPAQLIGIILY